MTNKLPEFGLVLSGGGARGMAHVGVIAALEKHGISPEVISGTSMGAVIGLLYAAGVSTEKMMDIARNRKLYNLFNWSFPKNGMLSLDLLREELQNSIPVSTFDALNKKLFVTVSNLTAGKAEVISEGEIFIPVIASASIPVIFEPQVIDGQTYVDGGLFSDLPVEPLDGQCNKITRLTENDRSIQL